MSEPGATAFGSPAQTAGGMLKTAREATGLHIAALAISLKVPVKKIEALEADRFDLLPDAVFVRALAASVCRALKIDAAPVLDKLPAMEAPNLRKASTSPNTPFRAAGQASGISLRSQLAKPAVLASLALVLAATALFLLPPFALLQQQALDIWSSATQLFTPDAKDPVDKPPGAPGSVNVGQAVAVPVSPSIGQPNLGISAVLASRPVAAASAALATSPPGAPPGANLASSPPIGTASGVVVFKALGESWVEVTDAKRVVVLRKTLAAGEAVGANGVLPLAVVVGRADTTQVQVRGKPFDLSANIRDNVARFEVK
jgi:cytoskeleton protein RodZ